MFKEYLQKSSFFWIISLLFIFVGAFIYLIQYLIFTDYSKWIKTEVKVLEYREEKNEYNTLDHLLICEYYDSSGKKHTIKHEIYSFETKKRTLKSFDIFYNPENPLEYKTVEMVKFRQEEAASAKPVMKIITIVFCGLGGIFAFFNIISLFVHVVYPDKTNAWYSFVNFLSGLLGACTFSIPSTFILPILYYAYMKKPNQIFEADALFVGHKNFYIGIIFTIVGIIVNIIIILVAKKSMSSYKEHGSFKGSFRKFKVVKKKL